MKGCASKHHKHYGGAIDSEPIAPLSIKQMNKFGGSTCPSCSSPTSFPRILGSYQNGGCGTCGMSGGGSTLQPVPAPFVGEAWGGKVSEWPGVDGVDSGRNYFTNNLYKADPQTMMKLYDWGGKGGSRRRHRRSKGKSGPCCSCKGVCSSACKCKGKCTSKCNCGCIKKGLKGGSLFPDLVSLGRDLTYNFESMYNSMNGYESPVNPKPYDQPALRQSQFTTKYY
jgi:hypothetical protein